MSLRAVPETRLPAEGWPLPLPHPQSPACVLLPLLGEASSRLSKPAPVLTPALRFVPSAHTTPDSSSQLPATHPPLMGQFLYLPECWSRCSLSSPLSPQSSLGTAISIQVTDPSNALTHQSLDPHPLPITLSSNLLQLHNHTLDLAVTDDSTPPMPLPPSSPPSTHYPRPVPYLQRVKPYCDRQCSDPATFSHSSFPSGPHFPPQSHSLVSRVYYSKDQYPSRYHGPSLAHPPRHPGPSVPLGVFPGQAPTRANLPPMPVELNMAGKSQTMFLGLT